LRQQGRWQTVDIQLTTLQKDQKIPKGPHRIPQLVRSKALSRSASRKAINHGKNGKNNSTCSSTLLIPHPWLQAPLLSTDRNLALHTPPTTWPATFTLKYQEHRFPCVSRTHGSQCSTDNRRHSRLGSSKLAAVPLNCTHWNPCCQSALELTLTMGLVPPEPPAAAPLDCAPGSPGQQSGPRTPAVCRLGSPEPAAATWGSKRAPGLPLSKGLVPPSYGSW
jgi:hypothetical protein